MIYRAIICALAIGLAPAAYAQDNCTPEAIQTKSGEVGTALQTIGARDQARVEELTVEIEALMTSIQNGGDIRTVCAFFDKVIDEANS
ncbi:hypothetical protein [Yoonia sp. 2307UL14-13]|uniref:hypothetical protein n=1 Tax=Yoonia sp. 2307UL14-13 TaxID=3126506 RepID=UPI0030A1A1BA